MLRFQCTETRHCLLYILPISNSKAEGSSFERRSSSSGMAATESSDESFQGQVIFMQNRMIYLMVSFDVFILTLPDQSKLCSFTPALIARVGVDVVPRWASQPFESATKRKGKALME